LYKLRFHFCNYLGDYQPIRGNASIENVPEFIERVEALLSECRNKAIYSGVYLCTLPSAEAARHLQLGFRHSNIPFCQIVGEGNAPMPSKSQYGFLLFLKSNKQVPAFNVQGSSPAMR
jgi:hypothetical protein